MTTFSIESENAFVCLCKVSLDSMVFIPPVCVCTVHRYDAINGMPAAQQSVTFEKVGTGLGTVVDPNTSYRHLTLQACILFNIAALYTQLAAQLDRSSAESIDKAVTYLEKAIGVFEFMKAKFSHSPTMDMSAEMLALFSDIMRVGVGGEGGTNHGL